MINLDDVTCGDLKKLNSCFREDAGANDDGKGLCCQIGEWVIIRTYSAGVWFGQLDQKYRNEVILKDARRMYRWQAAKSISLSGVAVHGIDRSESKIAPAVSKQWLEAIEIISLNDVAIDSIRGAENVEAE